MGRWGYLLFQGDDDLDAIEELKGEYDIDLDAWGDHPPLKDQTEEDRKGVMTSEHARTLLNGGLLTRVFADLKAFSEYDLYKLFLFCGKAMELGAHFTAAQLKTLNDRMPTIKKKGTFYDEGIAQWEKALAHYPNDGTRYDFESPGLIETMHANTTGGMINVPPNPPRRQEGGSNQPAEDDFEITDPLAAAVRKWLPKMRG